MEIIDIGRHCSVPHCHQLDYLPFKCPFCQHSYCLDHRASASHNQFVECKGRESIQVEVCSRCHVRLDGLQTQQGHVCKQSKTKCGLQGCKYQQTALLIACKDCQVRFCPSHRFADVHRCVKQVVNRHAAEHRRNHPSLGAR